MHRGTTEFVCDQCGNRFMDVDLEFMATSLSVLRQCPQCGSWHTMPSGILSMLRKSSYRRIWKSMDNQSEHEK